MPETFSQFWSGGRQFASEGDIRSNIQVSRNYGGENVADTHLLLLFDTSRQRTWLVATDKRLYCILDDVRKDRPKVQWSLDKNQIKDEAGNVTVEVSSADRRKSSGVVHIGPRRNWLYSKSRFQSDSVVDAITKLIQGM